MIKDIKILKKINDTLNAKGTILGLFKYKDKFYLSSYLKDKSGRAYCSVEESTLASYFNNELSLQEVFFASDDILVPRNFGTKTVALIKEQLTGLIASGKRMFSDNPDEMRNDSLAELFVGS
ncbi:MAG TPA: hypothetical protein VIT44_17745 [Cyclobacteriaceae bacterium]